MLMNLLPGLLRKKMGKRSPSGRSLMEEFVEGTPDIYATNWQTEFRNPYEPTGAAPSVGVILPTASWSSAGATSNPCGKSASGIMD